MKYPISIEAIRYPVILGSFCEEGYNQFVHKLFVFCELLVYSFAVKSDAIVDGFLLFVFVWRTKPDGTRPALRSHCNGVVS